MINNEIIVIYSSLAAPCPVLKNILLQTYKNTATNKKYSYIKNHKFAQCKRRVQPNSKMFLEKQKSKKVIYISYNIKRLKYFT